MNNTHTYTLNLCLLFFTIHFIIVIVHDSFHGWQLTDFGLSKVGLIDSTDDLSGPAVSGTSLLGEHESQSSLSEDQQERHKKRSAVGTPDYLAPEILLGTGHGLLANKNDIISYIILLSVCT